jgi:glutamate N-acetyltransferase/amino-acid N-acetyltransferase
VTIELSWIPEGGVTSPAGFRAGGVYAGIKSYGAEPRLDLGILASERPCAAAGIFTRNQVCGAPVALNRVRIANGSARAVVANSGISNVAMGEPGTRDAQRMTELAAEHTGIAVDEVLVASTGIIGKALPMDRIEAATGKIALSAQGGGDFARAIMTTDTVPKSRALRVTTGGRIYTVGGAAKGSGMIHPDMATMLCFLTTDAPAEPGWLCRTLRAVGDVSLNMIDVDSDTSTSDMMLLFANGAAGDGERPIDDGHPAADGLQRALEVLCIELAKDLARDGEGARTLIEVTVRGAGSVADARRAARTVASSTLLKAMVAGRDPNVGRVLMALGRSGARVDPGLIEVRIRGTKVFERGIPVAFDDEELARAMGAEQVEIEADLGIGDAVATAWGCDLTTEYIRINTDDTT